jgi:hypothetical protein
MSGTVQRTGCQLLLTRWALECPLLSITSRSACSTWASAHRRACLHLPSCDRTATQCCTALTLRQPLSRFCRAAQSRQHT